MALLEFEAKELNHSLITAVLGHREQLVPVVMSQWIRSLVEQVFGNGELILTSGEVEGCSIIVVAPDKGSILAQQFLHCAKIPFDARTEESPNIGPGSRGPDEWGILFERFWLFHGMLLNPNSN